MAKADSRQRSKWHHKVSDYYFIQGIGFLILFISWISQNIQEADWQEKKLKLDYQISLVSQTQQITLQQEATAKLFYAYSKILKDTNDFIKRNASRYFNSYTMDYITLKRLGNSILTDIANKMTVEKYDSMYIQGSIDSTRITKYAERVSIDTLNNIANELILDMQKGEFPNQLNKLREYIGELESKLKQVNATSHVLYIVGSILLAIAYLLKMFKPEL